MSVMKVRIVRVAMHERCMSVPMAVGLARRIVRLVLVAMVLVMRMPMLMLHRLVPMLMLVTLGQVQP